MLSVTQARDKAEKLVKQARAAGAEAADAIYIGERSSGVQVRKAALEDVHRSEGEEIGLRVFLGSKSASVASSDLSDEALSALVGRVLAMAGEAPDDPYAGLAPAKLLMSGDLPELDNWDADEPDPEVLKARALAAEDAALAVPGVTNSNGGNAPASASHIALPTTPRPSGRHQQHRRAPLGVRLAHRARHQPWLFGRVSGLRAQLLGWGHRRRGLGHAARSRLAQRPPRRRFRRPRGK